MRVPSGAMGICLLVLTVSAGNVARSQQTSVPAEPRVLQDGKDVVWVPTGAAMVDSMLDLADVTDKDHVIDLGSGDGRIVIAAAKRGATAVGVEYNADLVERSIRAAQQAEVSDKATFVKGDLFETDLSDATVVAMFLLPDLNLKLRPKLLELKPGTRVISNTFEMDRWKPDKSVTVPECKHYCTAHLWIVPANVSGRWLTSDGTLILEQDFQRVTGGFDIDGKQRRILDGELNGNLFSFRFDQRQYECEVFGDLIRGRIESEEDEPEWVAFRFAD